MNFSFDRQHVRWQSNAALNAVTGPESFPTVPRNPALPDAADLRKRPSGLISQVAADGQDPHDLKAPAPSITPTAAAAGDAATGNQSRRI
ncbi:hypothetical protein [Arthrobacter sp. 8AJ]|uniref:hypothetical protein n=1 Tax=Arthrobacter sp. 8AJ TaxID=2653130 RepID=UPI0012F018F2|nr:hypothetical protein [Arthrobacter sp. 8AJ]VXC11549.1 hypothetical protein ARTHRO8AJ_420108 [Arthrobacter sp. 8AJ]